MTKIDEISVLYHGGRSPSLTLDFRVWGHADHATIVIENHDKRFEDGMDITGSDEADAVHLRKEIALGRPLMGSCSVTIEAGDAEESERFDVRD